MNKPNTVNINRNNNYNYNNYNKCDDSMMFYRQNELHPSSKPSQNTNCDSSMYMNNNNNNKSKYLYIIY